MQPIDQGSDSYVDIYRKMKCGLFTNNLWTHLQNLNGFQRIAQEYNTGSSRCNLDIGSKERDISIESKVKRDI